MAIESMYVFTGDEVVATDLPAKLNENFAKTENNMLKTVNNVAQDENHNINVTELIPKQITSNTNLNNLVTSGEYTFTKGSANITNSPTTNSFFLTVLRNNALVKQVVTEVVLDDPITYTRVLNGSSWSPWVEGGKVKTINNINPDDSGNVDLAPMDYAVRSEMGIWKPNEDVSVGDVRYLNGRENAGKILKCVQAGTTDSSQPSITSDAILADFSSVYRIGAVRWIYNIAEKDEDEILATGVAYSRSAYSSLWTYAQSKSGLVISETEWQKKYTASGGKFVPYYSSGDGSSTFRTPLLGAYAKGNTDNSKIGTFTIAGLPDPNLDIIYRQDTISSGVYVDIYGNNGYTGSDVYNTAETDEYMQSSIDKGQYAPFAAIPTNSIYGNSDTVTPDTMNGVWVIKAFGTIVNSNNTDLKSVLSGIENISTRMNAHESNKFIVEAHRNGTEWYRVWSDGWIEQGGCLTFAGNSGIIITFTHPFADTNYYIGMSDYNGGSSSVQYNHHYIRNKAETNCKIYAGCDESISIQWYACGQGA